MNPELAFVGHTAYGTDIDKTESHLYASLAGGGLSPAIAASVVFPAERIGLVTVLGDDQFGKRAHTYIQRKGFNEEGVQIVQGGSTTWVVIQETATGRRIAVDAQVSRDFIPYVPDSYRDARYAHIGSGPSVAQLGWFQSIREEFSPQTIISADPLEPFVRQNPAETHALLERVDLIFINEEEFDLVSQYGTLVTQVPMILKLGDKGAVYIHGDQRIVVPAMKVQVVHTTGAGETVAGVFLGLRVQGVSIEEALSTAVEYASVSVTAFGIEHLDNSILAYTSSKTKGAEHA